MSQLRWWAAMWRVRWWLLRERVGLHNHLYHWADVKASLTDGTGVRPACYRCGKRPA